MGVASGCGCKEIYRFPHTTYPYSSCIYSFLQQHPNFFLGNLILCIKYFFHSVLTHIRASHGSHMKVVHNVLYMKKHTQTYVSYPACDGRPLYDFKEPGVDLEVEGVRYIEMHRGPQTYWARLLQGAEISN